MLFANNFQQEGDWMIALMSWKEAKYWAWTALRQNKLRKTSLIYLTTSQWRQQAVMQNRKSEIGTCLNEMCLSNIFGQDFFFPEMRLEKNTLQPPWNRRYYCGCFSSLSQQDANWSSISVYVPLMMKLFKLLQHALIWVIWDYSA